MQQMQLLRKYTPDSYPNPAKTKMMEAGLMRIEVWMMNDKTFTLYRFFDEIIDSREGNSLAKFHKKVYNES